VISGNIPGFENKREGGELNELIKIDGSNKITARELYDFLELAEGQFARWAKTNIESNTFYDEGIDWEGVDMVSNGNQCKDYKLTIDFSKHLAMSSLSLKGKQARQYFIAVEEKFKSTYKPQLDSKFLFQMATQLEDKENRILFLAAENNLLAQQNLEWADRNLLNAIIKTYGARIGFQDGWRDFKKELLYQHGINVNLRVTNRMNETGKKTKPATLDMIHDDEVSKCVSTAVALCKSKNVDISSILNKFTEQRGA